MLMFIPLISVIHSMIRAVETQTCPESVMKVRRDVSLFLLGRKSGSLKLRSHIIRNVIACFN